MLLIQQSSSFRVWTSRALMVYFRRALLFLVVSPYQYRNNKHCLLQQQQKVYFSDAEDDEEILMIDDKRKLDQSNRRLLKEYVFKKFSQGLNNSMKKSTEKDTINSSLIDSVNKSSSNQLSLIFDSVQPLVTESDSNQDSNSSSIKAINNTKTNESKIVDDFIYQYQANPPCSSRHQTSINDHNQIDTLPSYNPYSNYTNPMLFYPASLIYEKEKNNYILHSNLQSCPSCLSLSSICHSFDNETVSSESNEPSLSKSLTHYSSISSQQNLSQLSNDEDDIYEKYQTSFSHILHQTKSLHTICKEDKLHSMLVLEPNTSIITVRQLTYHPLNTNNSMITSHICVRLIANRTDLSVQCDTKPIGCKKSLSINHKQQENINPKNSLLILTDRFNHQLSSNKKLQATSIL